MTNPAWPLPSPDALGPMVGADDIRDAVKATIDAWSPYYLGVISQRLTAAGRILPGRKTQLPNFGHWRNDPQHRNLGAGQPAACLVTVPATVGVPKRMGTGLVWATWRSQVHVVVYGTDWQEAADLTSWYEKAVRWCILQHRSLGGVANTTTWVGSQYSMVQQTGTRTVDQVVLGFDVVVPDVVDTTRGPIEPPKLPTPPTPDPTVEDVVLDLVKVPVNESL